MVLQGIWLKYATIVTIGFYKRPNFYLQNEMKVTGHHLFSEMIANSQESLYLFIIA